MPRRAGFLIVLGILAAAPSAATAAGPALRDDIEAGPAFRGGRVIWAETRDRAGHARTVLRTRVRTLATPRPVSGPGTFVDLERPQRLLASPTHLALVRGLDVCGRHPDAVCSLNPVDLVAGPAVGPWATVRTTKMCRDGPVAPSSFDLAGNLLAFTDLPSECPRSDPVARLIVRDLRAGAASDRVLARSGVGFEVRAAGRLVAWKRVLTQRNVISVFDLDRGRVVRRIEAAAVGASAFKAWDLATDGTVVTASNRGGLRPARLAWWPAGSARPRRLRLPPVLIRGETAELHITGGRVAYLAERPGLDPYENADLMLVRLRGGARRIARFTPRRRQFGQVAFDGGRLAWAEQRVRRTRARCVGSPETGVCFQIPIGPRRIVVRRVTGR